MLVRPVPGKMAGFYEGRVTPGEVNFTVGASLPFRG